MFAREALRFSLQALRANPVRTLLTCLGMLIGNASVILVVTISLTSREYILEQIQGIGSNMIFAYFETGTQDAVRFAADYIKIADVEAVREQLAPSIVAATGVMTEGDRILIDGRQQDVRVIGSDQDYAAVRNLVIGAGRFLDESDVTLRSKAAILTDKLAIRMYGSQTAAVGQVIKLFGLQFTVIGTFREKVDSFGQTEVTNDTIVIPITVLRYFTEVERIDPLYVQVRSASDVEAVTRQVQQILESRHRPGARYRVENLQAILDAAKNISLILQLVLILVSAIALVISGIGIMNIMLVTVTERTREIGVRMAVGASRRWVLTQFLAEAVIISLVGGVAGILVGVAIPLSAQLFLENLRIPVSYSSIAIAFAVSCSVGLLFGMLPANRAARLNPTEALRYE
ncbi:MAG: ABC transporter permease [Bryobacterales bacterium]|nr:ABC transporter permease [Bryobacterales bacterium]